MLWRGLGTSLDLGYIAHILRCWVLIVICAKVLLGVGRVLVGEWLLIQGILGVYIGIFVSAGLGCLLSLLYAPPPA